jgi:hypothetical protein
MAQIKDSIQTTSQLRAGPTVRIKKENKMGPIHRNKRKNKSQPNSTKPNSVK